MAMNRMKHANILLYRFIILYISLIILSAFILSGCANKSPSNSSKEKLSYKRSSKIHGDFPSDELNLLESPKVFIFMTLKVDDEAYQRKGKTNDKYFHGYEILGKQIINAKVQNKLIQSLYKSIEKERGSQADCFWPRHAVQVIKGKHILDLLICFECGKIYIDHYFSKQKTSYSVLTSDHPEVFNQVANELGLPLDKRNTNG